MAIKEGSRTGHNDEINEVVGSQGFYMRYYFTELKKICFGEHQRGLVGVSRFYPMLEPRIDSVTGKELPKLTPVVVDFEPAKGDGPMFLEQKRKFFMERQIIYVPIFLNELLTREQFVLRLEEERKNLIHGFREAMEDKAMDSVEIPMFNNEQLIAEARALALERVTALGLRGAAKNKRLAREIETILKEKVDGVGSNRRQV